MLHPRVMTAGLGLILPVLSAGACAQSVRSDAPAAPPDSIVLERTLCYGTCPAYRLSLTQRGQVAFESRNPGDSGRQERDTIPAMAIIHLAATADSLGFATLPDTIANDRALCPDMATDHPTVTVTLFRGGKSKHVVDYHGCFAQSDHSTVPVVGQLRALEARIDSSAGVKRWTRPADRR